MSSHSGREAGRHTWPQSHREPDAGSAARVGFRSPADLQAKADAFAAEHGLVLPPGMAWSYKGLSVDGEVLGVMAVNRPGFVLPSGHRHGSEAWRHRRRVLRRHLARCRSMAVLCAAVMVGAFAADRPIAGVLAASLVFMLLREAAVTRAEL